MVLWWIDGSVPESGEAKGWDTYWCEWDSDY